MMVLVVSETCLARAEQCTCVLPKDHKGEVHMCACLGQWVGEGDDYIPIHIPVEYGQPRRKN